MVNAIIRVNTCISLRTEPVAYSLKLAKNDKKICSIDIYVKMLGEGQFLIRCHASVTHENRKGKALRERSCKYTHPQTIGALDDYQARSVGC